MKFGKTVQQEIDACGVWRDKFAYFPTQMDDGSYVWLETYEQKVTHHIFLWECIFTKSKRKK